MTEQGSPWYHKVLTIIPSYFSKVTPIGALHAEKIAEIILLYVFRIAFPGPSLNKWGGKDTINLLFSFFRPKDGGILYVKIIVYIEIEMEIENGAEIILFYTNAFVIWKDYVSSWLNFKSVFFLHFITLQKGGNQGGGLESKANLAFQIDNNALY